MSKITDIILKSMQGGYAVLTLFLICIIVIFASFMLLSWLFHLRMATDEYPLPRPHGFAGTVKFLSSLPQGTEWYAETFLYVVAVIGLVIACWGFTFSIVSGDPMDFARSGALVTLLGFAIAFLKSSYAKGVYQAVKSVDPTRADSDRLEILSRAEGMSSKWGVWIIIPGTLIWGYGDLISKKVEKRACENQWRLAVHYCLPKAPSPLPPPPTKLLVIFDWNSTTLQPAAEEIIWEVAQDSMKDPNAEVHLVGHADESGSPAYNHTLSERRANAVRTELLKLGLNTTRIIVSSKGSSDPLVSPGNKAREALNRNVEILIDHPPPSTSSP